MLAGLTAGAIAAIIAALVSLPLHSPVDSAFNSATVAIAALVVGGISGLLWSRFTGQLKGLLIGLAIVFLIALVVAFAGNAVLDRMVSYMLPLAAIVVVVCAVLTPLLASFFLKPSIGMLKWLPVVAIIAALAVGFALVTQGDAVSGELTLPPPPSLSGESATAVPAGTTAASETTAGTGGGTGKFEIGEGSEISFTVEEELGRAPVRFDAVISSTGLTGTADLEGGPSVVTLDLHSLQSDQQFRDGYIRNTMFPDNREAVVTVEELPSLPSSFFDGEEITGQLDGSLQIGETTTPLVFDVTARHDGEAVSVLGKTTFTWEQLGLSKPSARSVVYLADEVRVEVLLVAQPAP